jgi:predicted DNA binding CopG/RHH family protein
MVKVIKLARSSKPIPMVNKMKLNKEEKELLKSYDNGKWKSIKDFEKKKNEYQQIARNTAAKRKHC